MNKGDENKTEVVFIICGRNFVLRMLRLGLRPLSLAAATDKCQFNSPGFSNRPTPHVRIYQYEFATGIRFVRACRFVEYSIPDHGAFIGFKLSRFI